MKLLLIVFLAFILFSGYSQTPHNWIPSTGVFRLIANNGKHLLVYYNYDALKIFYGDSGHLKAKGRLFILDSNHIQLIPPGRKKIVTIGILDVKSIGRWKRNAKIAAVILAISGAATAGLASITTAPSRPGFADANILPFLFLLYSVSVVGYEIISIPSIIISEKISIRSGKKGYHFYIDNSKTFHGGR